MPYVGFVVQSLPLIVLLFGLGCWWVALAWRLVVDAGGEPASRTRIAVGAVLCAIGVLLFACGAERGGLLLIGIVATYAGAIRFLPGPSALFRATCCALALGALAIAMLIVLAPQFTELRVRERRMRMPALEAAAAPVLAASARFRLERGRPPRSRGELVATGWIAPEQFRVSADSELVIAADGEHFVELFLAIAPNLSDADRIRYTPGPIANYVNRGEQRWGDWTYSDDVETCDD